MCLLYEYHSQVERGRKKKACGHLSKSGDNYMAACVPSWLHSTGVWISAGSEHPPDLYH